MNADTHNLVYKSDFRALGTDIKIFIVGEVTDKNKIEKDFRILREMYRQKEKILSRFDLESELSKLNSRLGFLEKASADIAHLAEKSLEYYEESRHYFDPRILETLENIGYAKDFKSADFKKQPVKKETKIFENSLGLDLEIKGQAVIFRRRMDFSGIAKGYTTDLAAKYLSEKGWKNFLVDSGGDIYAGGKNDHGENWQIEVEGIPEDKLTLSLTNSGAATSGITRRKWGEGEKKYHHLINPLSPNKFSFDLRSVTVIEKNCERADVLAKTLYLMGREKGLLFSREKNIKSIFLDYRGNAHLSYDTRKEAII